MEKDKEKNPLDQTQAHTLHVSKTFKHYLTHVSIDEDDHCNIMYLLNFFRFPQDPAITSKTFVFYGRTGVGKTFLAEKILNELHKEIIYNACKPLHHPNAIRCETIKDIFSHINESTDQVIFLDDLSYLFSVSDYGEYQTNDKRELMNLLELVKQQANKILIITMNGLNRLDDQLIDRMEVIIYVDIPDQHQKKQYLNANYKKYLSAELRDYIADNSIGYNYRDLPEMLKLAYRKGNHQITRESVKSALRVYQPTQLYGFQVENAVTENLSDVIGKKKPLRIMKRLVTQYQNHQIYEQLNLRRNNVLLFYGPPGTGKSFMTRALAGEIGFPLIHVSTDHFHGRNPFHGIHIIMDMAKRYQRCVIFVDEAEKMLGNERYGDDNPVLGELHRLLDGGDGGQVQSILVFALNDLSRFGTTLLDRFNLVEFDLPCFEERMEFFKDKIKQVGTRIHIPFTERDLAFRSEKMSFREMDRFWIDLVYTQLEGGRELLEEGCLNRSTVARGEVMYG